LVRCCRYFREWEQEGSIKLWRHLYEWPDGLKDEADFEAWILNTFTGIPSRDKRLAACRDIVVTGRINFAITTDWQEYRGHMREVLIVQPLNSEAAGKIFLPRYVKKIILMSATFSQVDLESLGFDPTDAVWIPVDSEIPAGNRPVKPLNVAPITFDNDSWSIPRITGSIEALLDTNNTPGIIHCTYSLAEKLKTHLSKYKRIVWHDRGNRTAVYKKFVSGEYGTDAVLIACGMSEGIDLAYSLARWQVICKVPYRSLADFKSRESSKKNPELYAWWAVRTIMQATGRVCRNPDDYGITYILDSNFNKLLKEWPHLWPDYYKHSIIT